MRELQVIFHSLRDMGQFVQLAARQPGAVDVTLDNRTVSGKDWLGMVTLELERGLRVFYNGSDQEFQEFAQSVQSYLV